MARWPGVFSKIKRYTVARRIDRRTTRRSRKSPRPDHKYDLGVSVFTYHLECGHAVIRETWCMYKIRCEVCTAKR